LEFGFRCWSFDANNQVLELGNSNAHSQAAQFGTLMQTTQSCWNLTPLRYTIILELDAIALELNTITFFMDFFHLFLFGFFFEQTYWVFPYISYYVKLDEVVLGKFLD
jgi:hypothetical protein